MYVVPTSKPCPLSGQRYDAEWDVLNSKRVSRSPARLPARTPLEYKIKVMFREKFSKDTYSIDSISGMNEVYVSGPAKSGSSDTVFTTRHIDGPWALVPFCSTYRCILGLDSSAVYTTVFPNVTGRTTTCRTGDIVCFDYNREIHYIEGYARAKEEQAKLAPADGGDGYRIVLKVSEFSTMQPPSAKVFCCPEGPCIYLGNVCISRCPPKWTLTTCISGDVGRYRQTLSRPTQSAVG